MSNVNIKRLVKNIRENTNVYGAITEVIVNAIHATDEIHPIPGRIEITLLRSPQTSVDGIPEVIGVEVKDNGVGFTKEHYRSFDTLYSDQKASKGGKGFGRFVCLKHFESFSVKSVFREQSKFFERRFSLGDEEKIIVNDSCDPCTAGETGSIVTLSGLRKEGALEKKLNTVANFLVEILLPYFIAKDYSCPKILLLEQDRSDHVLLNDYENNELSTKINEIQLENGTFFLNGHGGNQSFNVRLFKIYSPRNQKSKIILVADQRKVTQAPIENYVPEFSEEFYEKSGESDANYSRNYIVTAYVFGNYLDEHVSHERGNFNFSHKADLTFGISQSDIEFEAAKIAKYGLGEDLRIRTEKKLAQTKEYVDQRAPWYKPYIKDIDLSALAYNPSDDEIEMRLYSEKYTREVSSRKKAAHLLEQNNLSELRESVQSIVEEITEDSKGNLVHYVAQRKVILDLFKKSIQKGDDGKYKSEATVHDIIFPRGRNSDNVSYEEHNLWMLDERLNFTHYIASEYGFSSSTSDRADLIIYDKMMVFRGDNDASNPIVIFEFKKPMRDDFANMSAKEDPVEQLIRYVNVIRGGRVNTPQGRPVSVQEHTPFYGYIICDLSPKVVSWLRETKDFSPMPDQLGWYTWRKHIRLYIEVLSWDKVLKDAFMRNSIFFHTLGL